MTEKQIKQVKSQLPQGEKIDRMYTAFEGGVRLITKDKNGYETRYNISFDKADNVYITKL